MDWRSILLWRRWQKFANRRTQTHYICSHV